MFVGLGTPTCTPPVNGSWGPGSSSVVSFLDGLGRDPVFPPMGSLVATKVQVDDTLESGCASGVSRFPGNLEDAV